MATPARPERARRGRAPLPEAQRLTQIIRVRLTAEEADALYRLAREARIDLGPYLRERLRRFLVAPKIAPEQFGPIFHSDVVVRRRPLEP